MARLRRAADRLAAGLYALYGWCVLLLVAVPTWLLVAVLPVADWRWAVVRWFSRTLFWATGVPITVHGRENLPAAGTPYIIVSNHMSYLDSPVLTATLPGPYSFVAKAELLDQFVPRVFLKRIGTEFVERFDARKGVEDAKRIADIASSGRPLLYFAEGTLTRMPGLLPFHMGAFQTAVEAGLPVIPIAIRGTRSILRDQSAFPRRGAVSLVIDRPIDPASLTAGAGDDTWTRAIRLRDADAGAHPQALRGSRTWAMSGRSPSWRG